MRGAKQIALVVVLVALAALTGFWPFENVDAAEVVPVETLVIARDGETIQLYADDGLTAQGPTLAQALEQMAAAAPGTVFFGTVQRVILTQNAMDLTKELFLRTEFRPSVWVYAAAGQAEEADAAVLAAYEARQKDGATLCRVIGAALGGPTVQVAKVEIRDGSWQRSNVG